MRRRRYEYSTEGFHPIPGTMLMDYLNARGNDGWQLVSCESKDPTERPHVTYALVFMREITR